MEKVWENDDFIIFNDGEYFYVYQRQDVVDGWELTEFFFCSSSLEECFYYTE